MAPAIRGCRCEAPTQPLATLGMNPKQGLAGRVSAHQSLLTVGAHGSCAEHRMARGRRLCHVQHQVDARPGLLIRGLPRGQTQVPGRFQAGVRQVSSSSKRLRSQTLDATLAMLHSQHMPTACSSAP